MAGTSNNLRAGVIGLGVGERHLMAYNETYGVEVKSICDIDESKLDEVGARHGIKHRFTEYQKITEDPEIDLVSICTYDDDHAEHAISAFNHGKHVMVEKPLAVTREQADAVIEAYQVSGKLITSNLILRRSPRFIDLKDRIQRGDMGELYYMEGDYIHHIPHKLIKGWRGGISFYSPMFGGGIHLIDLVRWLSGDEVVEVCAMGTQKVTASTRYPFDDTNLILLRFSSGTLCKVGVTLVPAHPKFHALRVFGTKATFINQLGDADWYIDENPSNRKDFTAPYPAMEKGDLLPDFINSIRGGREPNVGAKDVFRVMEICLAAQESRATGNYIKTKYSI